LDKGGCHEMRELLTAAGRQMTEIWLDEHVLLVMLRTQCELFLSLFMVIPQWMSEKGGVNIT
jgi:hypothetical protein